MKTVIDPTVKVASRSATASLQAVGENRCIRTSGMPSSSAMPMWPTMPVMWNRGATASTTSSRSRPTQSRYTWLLKAMLPWVFIAPFGGPVVPEV